MLYAKVSIECEVDGNYELENFDHFICKLLATYADEYGIQYVAMDGCGHSPQGQHSDRFTDIIRDFLLEVD